MDSLRERAEARLSVQYEEDGKWSIRYEITSDPGRCRRAGRMRVLNSYPAEQALAQIRGMLADFAQDEMERFVKHLTSDADLQNSSRPD